MEPMASSEVTATRALIRDELLAATRPLHPAEIAHRLGLHVNTVRHHLELLEQSDEVIRHQEANGHSGRRRVMYAVPSGPSRTQRCLAHAFLARVLVAYVAVDHDDPRDVGLRVGTAWGRHLTDAPPFTRTPPEVALERVRSLLGRIGMPILAHEREGELRVEAGAFTGLGPAAPSFAAGLLHGLAAGAFDALGAGLRVVEVDASDGRLLLRYEEPERRSRHGASRSLRAAPG